MPFLAYVIDIHHPDFDTCAYLLCYIALCEAVWGLAQGIIYFLLPHLESPHFAWQPPFMIFSAGFLWRKADAARDMFLTLERMLGSGLPFALIVPMVVVWFVGAGAFFIGFVIASMLGCEVYALRLKSVYEVWYAAYPTAMPALVALVGVVLMLTASLFFKLDSLLLSETPPNWIGYRVTNFLARRVRARIAGRRLDMALTFLRSRAVDESLEYEYPPLRNGQFRLLKLDADRGPPGTVVSSLEIYHMKTHPSYQAISYCWGEPTMSHSMMVENGHGQLRQIGLTKNAHDALAALCPLQGSTFFWMDSICIDQSNPDEKDTQIPLMRHIYRTADRVIAYLGHSRYAGLANHFIARTIWHAMYVGIPSDKRPFDVAVPFRTDSRGWKAFQELISNDIWSRAWIFQEMVVAKELVIHNGDSTFHWSLLHNLEALFRYRMRAPYIRERHDAAGQYLYSQADLLGAHEVTLQHRRRWIEHPETQKPQQLADLLVDLRKLKASRPEDKVNAFLGVSDSQFDIDLRPDHRKTVEQVYTAAALHTLRSGSFLLFSISGLCHKRSDLQLPSWVPDLSMPPWYGTEGAYTRGYRAGGFANPRFKASNDGQELNIFGYIIDEIKVCAEERPELDRYPFYLTAEDVKNRETDFYNLESPYSPLRRLHHILLEMLNLLALHSPENTKKHALDLMSPQTPMRIIVRALAEDWDNMKYPADDQLFRSYLEFMHLITLLDEQRNPSSPSSFPTKWRRRREAQTQIDKLLWSPFQRRAENVSWRRNFAVTRYGYAAMVPKGTREGDVLCVFVGSPVIHVLRAKGDGRYFLFGDCYLDGFMSGEGMRGEGRWITLM